MDTTPSVPCAICGKSEGCSCERESFSATATASRQDLPTNDCVSSASEANDVRGWRGWTRSGYNGLCHFWPSLCNLLGRWRHDAFRFDPETLEIQTGAMAMSLGVWLCFLPHHVAGRPSNFSLMVLNLWPAFVWVALFLLVGIAQILALKCRWLGARCVCAMIGLWLWLFVAALLTLEGLSGPSVAIFPVIALSEAWVYLRLRAHSDISSCATPPEATSEEDVSKESKSEETLPAQLTTEQTMTASADSVPDSNDSNCDTDDSSPNLDSAGNDSNQPDNDCTPVPRT